MKAKQTNQTTKAAKTAKIELTDFVCYVQGTQVISARCKLTGRFVKRSLAQTALNLHIKQNAITTNYGFYASLACIICVWLACILLNVSHGNGLAIIAFVATVVCSSLPFTLTIEDKINTKLTFNRLIIG